MKEMLERVDNSFVAMCGRLSHPFARISIFVVFFWFGILKVFDLSPANPLVAELLEKTLPFMTFETFIVLFGLYEMVIGVAFLIPRLERLAITLLIPHMITTILPLFLLPAVAWQSVFVPTLEGQYIIKNILIIALAFVIGAHLKPMRRQSLTQ
jgi:uncharacterized membrane protein YkgB